MSYSCTFDNSNCTTIQTVQSSAVTDLRWGENFHKFLFRNSVLNMWNKHENRSVFARVAQK